MCIGMPGQVVRMAPGRTDMAEVSVEGVVRHVNVALLDEGSLDPGDWVLIHIGFALEKVSEAEAHEALSLFDELEAAFAGRLEEPVLPPAGSPPPDDR